jgi:L-fucose isomerase-like protein
MSQKVQQKAVDAQILTLYSRNTNSSSMESYKKEEAALVVGIAGAADDLQSKEFRLIGDKANWNDGTCQHNIMAELRLRSFHGEHSEHVLAFCPQSLACCS